MAADTSAMDTSQLFLEPSQEEKDELLEDLPVHVLGDTKEELGVSEAGVTGGCDISDAVTPIFKVSYNSHTCDVVPRHVCRPSDT